MTVPENTDLLTALEGTHPLSTGERNEAALRTAVWLDFLVGGVATAVLAALVAGLSPLTWDHMSTIPGYLVMGSAFLGAAFLLARWSGVRGYVIDANSVIAEAASVRGSFAWVLTLSLKDGSARVLALPESMRRTLDLEGSARAASQRPPNKGLHQTKRGVEDGSGRT